MRISPFAHYFELMAGATSALAIIPQVHDFIAEKLNYKFKQQAEKISRQIWPLISGIEEIKKTITFSEQEKNVASDKLKIATQDDFYESVKIENYFKRKLRKLDADTEIAKINRIGYSLCVFSCLYCVFMLILSGFTETEDLRLATAFRLIGTCQILIIPFVLILAFCITRDFWATKSCFKIASGLFLSPVALSLFFMWLTNWGVEDAPELFNIIISLIIAASPFIAIIFRIFILWPIRFYNFEQDFPIKRTKLLVLQGNLRSVQDHYLPPQG